MQCVASYPVQLLLCNLFCHNVILKLEELYMCDVMLQQPVCLSIAPQGSLAACDVVL